MRLSAIVIALSIAGLLVCSCIHAESRVRVYADVDKPVVLGHSPDRVVVRVGLEGLTVPVMPMRPPLNVAIVLDKSGSMASDYKIENAKRGAIEIVKRLQTDDIISLVVYASYPQVIIPAQRVGHKDALIEVISGIHPGGSTALYGGVTYGATQVRKNMSWRYLNRIILLSDGLANVGPQSTHELAYLGQTLADEGITVTTIGVGLDYNEDLMTALAARSGGNAYFASTGSELPKIFAEEIGEAMTVAARDVRIRVRCPRGVKPIGVIGREGEISGQTMAVKVGELYGKNDKFALFEVEVPEQEPGKSLEIAEVTVEYADPLTNQATEAECNVTVKYDDSQDAVDSNQNKQVIKEAALAKTSEIKREAVSLADRGKHAAAASLIKKNAFELEKVARECDNDDEIIAEVEMCEELSSDIKDNSGLTKYQRKRVVNQIYGQITQQGYVSEEDKDKDKDEKKDENAN
jgi:Ca-activated chloride channel family protein